MKIICTKIFLFRQHEMFIGFHVLIGFIWIKTILFFFKDKGNLSIMQYIWTNYKKIKSMLYWNKFNSNNIS